MQHRLVQCFLPMSRLDRHFYAKLMQTLFLGDGLSRSQKLQMFAYPLLTAPRTYQGA
jgi:hypothetical protein